MVTLQTADNALKSFYLDAVAEALNTKTNPLLAKIQQTTANVVGKDVRKLVKVGVNGGIGAGSETGDLPTASSNDYVQMVATLKNLYGTIEISDKAIRASANNEGAFVNLLNDEMQSLIKSASFNFGRMLFGDGSGRMCYTTTVLDGNIITVSNTNGLAEGMYVDFYTPLGEPIDGASGHRILAVDREKSTITVDGPELNSGMLSTGSGVIVQGSSNHEITGIGALFKTSGTLYGLERTSSLMKPYRLIDVGAISDLIVQKAIDTIEERSGSKVNFIICSWGVRRALTEYCRANNVPLPTVDVDGEKALSFNGIPVFVDRFCPKGAMYLLNTDDFKMHQLCDWQWLEGEDGKVLKQIPGKPVYTATLVKYAELICERPCGQGYISGITEV
ncbi:MAG: phage major capsid protein [Clostridia bacterium]|nr:phage major capsid protein [Clostridia bacterium]